MVDVPICKETIHMQIADYGIIVSLWLTVFNCESMEKTNYHFTQTLWKSGSKSISKFSWMLIFLSQTSSNSNCKQVVYTNNIQCSTQKAITGCAFLLLQMHFWIIFLCLVFGVKPQNRKKCKTLNVKNLLVKANLEDIECLTALPCSNGM